MQTNFFNLRECTISSELKPQFIMQLIYLFYYYIKKKFYYWRCNSLIPLNARQPTFHIHPSISMFIYFYHKHPCHYFICLCFDILLCNLQSCPTTKRQTPSILILISFLHIFYCTPQHHPNLFI